MMIALHFGAGNIGRGFIGQLLHQSGYEVHFVDVNLDLVNLINQKQEYQVKLAQENQEVVTIRGVRAVHGQDQETINELISKAAIITTAVGPHILSKIAPTLRVGIQSRLKTNQSPLIVIACENMIKGSSNLKGMVEEQLTKEDKIKLAQSVHFLDAAVDRIVPLQNNEDPLEVLVEPYFEWVVENSSGIDFPIPIQGAHIVQDLTPYIERKLYTVNTGHSMLAYLGSYLGLKTIEEATKDPYIYENTLGAMKETGELLISKYSFTQDEQGKYIQSILARFSNPYITDDVVRVGRSPIRKLAPNDRLVGPALQAFNQNIKVDHLTLGIGAALLFDFPEDQESVEIQQSIQEIGMEQTISKYTELPQNHPLFSIILAQLEKLAKLKK